VLRCIASLEALEEPWAADAAATIRRACPLSIACAFEIIRTARGYKTIEQALDLEYRFTSRSISHGDFIEGIRAQIIDKDRKPMWKIPDLEAVTADDVAAMLAPVAGGRKAFESR
jgi:enoyl-CoA hydratase/carnithine racemase